MLRHFVIFLMFLSTVYASGEISLLTNSKGLQLQGDEALHSDYVRDVLNVAMGYGPRKNVDWSGLYVKDPFYVPQRAIAVLVDDMQHLNLFSDSSMRTYLLDGSSCEESLVEALYDFKSQEFDICDIDFKNQHARAAWRDYAACFGEEWDTFVWQKVFHLHPNFTEDFDFIQAVSIINDVANKLLYMHTPSFLLLRLSLAPITAVYGDDSPATDEAIELLSKALYKLKRLAYKFYYEDLFIAILADVPKFQRMKRAEPSNPHNIADHYDEDFPVVFNITLWLSVGLGVALLAISYALMAMDPGRNSIIYRKTPDTTNKKRN